MAIHYKINVLVTIMLGVQLMWPGASKAAELSHRVEHQVQDHQELSPSTHQYDPGKGAGDCSPKKGASRPPECPPGGTY
jgi:hypothetical protein